MHKLLTIGATCCVLGSTQLIFSQAIPPGPPISATMVEKAVLLSKLGWRDGMSANQKVFDDVVAYVVSLGQSGDDVKPDLADLVNITSGSDQLCQAIYKGILGSHLPDVAALHTLFRKITLSADPEGLPGRSRFWAKRWMMLTNIARIIYWMENRKEISEEDLRQVSNNPEQWMARYLSERRSGAGVSNTDVMNTASIVRQNSMG
jgi:hypothetical protein